MKPYPTAPPTTANARRKLASWLWLVALCLTALSPLQAQTALATPPRFQVLDPDTGAFLVAGKVYTFLCGTSTPKATYSDQSGGAANTNPVELDGSGSADIWLGVGCYKVTVANASDVVIYTVDNVQGPVANAFTSLSVAGVTIATADLDDVTPAAISGVNIKWQKDVSTPINVSGYIQAASTAQSGVAEAAIASEVNTGTDASRYVSPDALAGSNLGRRVVQLVVFDFATDNTTGNGKFYFDVPAEFSGMNLVGVRGKVYTTGTTGVVSVALTRCAVVATGNPCSGTTVQMLSTNLTVDSGEASSDTAATAAVIDAASDDVTTDQVIRVDVAAIHTTPAKGLSLTLSFQLP